MNNLFIYKIVKNQDHYELIDGDNVLGKIFFKRKFFNPVDTAKIIIGDKIYNTEYSWTYLFVFGAHCFLKLFDSSHNQISILEWESKRDPIFPVINLNNIEYNFSSRVGSFGLLISSSGGWFDSNNNEYVYLKTISGTFNNPEISVETKLDINDDNTKLLALWGFHLLPVPKSGNKIIMIFTIFIVCPLLLYVLYLAFSPYFI
jgi:hypothetical protein